MYTKNALVFLRNHTDFPIFSKEIHRRVREENEGLVLGKERAYKRTKNREERGLNGTNGSGEKY